MKPSKRRKSPAAQSGAAAAKTGESAPASTGGVWPWVFGAGLVLLALFLYAPSLNGPFILDDFDLMEVFSAVRVGDWAAVLRTGRPLLMLSYVANHRWAGGFEPFGFHLTNVFLHALNALLLWRFLAALFAPGRFEQYVPPGLRNVLVYGVPLLFLTSPIQTESVAYISSRSEVLSATFYLLALWIFASTTRERYPWPTAIAVLVLAGAAALTKQDKVTLPFALLLLDYLLLSERDLGRLKRNWPTYGMFAAGLVAAFFVVIRPFLFALSAGFGLDWKTYLFTQFRMVFRYLRLLLVPVGLNLDPDIAASHTLWEHFSWLALLGVALLVAAAIRYHRRAPVVAFGVLFFFVTLAPSTSFYPLLDFAAERRVYLPAIGFFLVALILLYRLLGSAKQTGAAVVLVAALYSVGTYQRSTLWANDLLLWQDTAEKSPGKARPWMWLGRIYIERDPDAYALQVLERGEQVVEPESEEHAYLLSNVGLAHAHLKEYEKAVAAYRRAIAMYPREPRFHAQLAVALLRLERKEEGWKAFEAAFSRPHNLPPEIYRLRGQEHYLEGRYVEAAEDFRQALFLRDDDEVARTKLAATEEMIRRMQ